MRYKVEEVDLAVGVKESRSEMITRLMIQCPPNMNLFVSVGSLPLK